MNLWRLEWLRLIRTHRLTALLAVFVLFGFVGPLSTYYLPDILRRFGGGVEVKLPAPTPADGIGSYVDNVLQLGLLVLVLVAGAALSFDSQRESAAFLRTRVAGIWRLLLPKVVVNSLAAAGVFLLGSAAAWYETEVLFGGLPVLKTAVGLACAVLYFVFTVAVTALASAVLRGVVGTALASLAVLLLLASAEALGVLGAWSPSHLAGAPHALALGGDPVDYLPSAVVTIVAIGITLPAAAWLLNRRDT